MGKGLSHLVLCVLCILMSVGCGTAINGERQDVIVNSVPPGAEIWVDGAASGRTPAILTIRRNGDHTLRLVKDGFADTTVTISSSVNGEFFLNILYPGLLGCAGDLMTGGGSSLSPDRVFVDLVRSTKQKDEH